MKKLIIAAVMAVSALTSVAANASYLNYRVAGEGNVLISSDSERAVTVTDQGQEVHWHLVDTFQNGSWVNGVYENNTNRNSILIIGVNEKAGFTTFVAGYRNSSKVEWSWKIDNRYVTVGE